MDKNYSKLSFKNISYENANLKEINIFCFKRILVNLIKYFFKYSLNDIYIKSLVETYSPKIVISQNLEGYAYRVKYLCDKVFCITYQHSFFYENEKALYKKLFKGSKCDLFIAYHDDDIKYLSSLIKAKFISLGSVKNNEINLEKIDFKKIPLLLISEYRQNPSKLHLDKQIELCNYIKKFCKIKNIIPHVALSANREDKSKYDFLKEELNFFKKHLTNFYWENENSFVTANNSNLIICLSSNMGIETLSRGFKTIFFNLIGDKDKLQINPYLSKTKPDYFFQQLSEKEILKKLIYYFDLSNEKWKKDSNFKKNGIFFDEGNIFFKKEVIKILNENSK